MSTPLLYAAWLCRRSLNVRWPLYVIITDCVNTLNVYVDTVHCLRSYVDLVRRQVNTNSKRRTKTCRPDKKTGQHSQERKMKMCWPGKEAGRHLSPRSQLRQRNKQLHWCIQENFYKPLFSTQIVRGHIWTNVLMHLWSNHRNTWILIENTWLILKKVWFAWRSIWWEKASMFAKWISRIQLNPNYRSRWVNHCPSNR